MEIAAAPHAGITQTGNIDAGVRGPDGLLVSDGMVPDYRG